MFKNKKVTAIITAAGKGSRMGASLPKQFMRIGGRMILQRAVDPFESSPFVDEILLVAGEEYMSDCRLIGKGYEKVCGIVHGGRQRQDSVKNALDRVSSGYVLIHDGARPYVTEDVIERVLETAAGCGAAVPAVPVKETVRQGDANSSLTLDRSSLHTVQTPQGFEAELIKKAFDRAYEEGFYGTDDAGLVERLGHEVALCRGDYANIKITTGEDMPMEMRVGSGYDVHRLEAGRRLVLCGVEIPFERGLLGHSDADVALHALMDAMLGAAALGDIGRHFPDSDAEYKGISSMKLLETVCGLLDRQGWAIGNADITIMAQRPKLSPYIEQMKSNIAAVLGAAPEAVNVKATTTEKLGFVGREEGIAAEAVCIINRKQR